MTSDKKIIDEIKLDRLANVAVNVGLGLKEGQDIVLTAPISALPLVRRIAHHAYKAGAGVVIPFFSDEQLSLERFHNANEASFDRAANWLYEGMAKAFENGAARLAIAGDNPLLLSQENPQKVARLNKATSLAYQPALAKIAGFDINWNIISYPNPSWARVVFPELNEDEATYQLAEAIFKASRVENEDAVAAWQQHNKQLHLHSSWLNGQNFTALHFKSAITDLTVGLADQHEWHGGASTAKNGIICNPNIPTEEVFTTPHRNRIEGYVGSTKPLSHQGTLIDDIFMRFENGKVVEAKASKGEAVLNKVLDSDEGARHLGEVALVPHSSPISASGLLFYNTLFDENAACHIAMGQCYSKCFKEGGSLTPAQIAQFGGNQSLIHIDWMIGGKDMDIDGIKADGSRVAVFRQGEWAFKL